MWVRTVDCLGLAVEVRADAATASAVEPFLSPYAESSAPPALRYELTAAPPRLLRDTAVVVETTSLPLLVSRFELDLYRALARLASGPLLHAAALGFDGQALVFAGPSGAGKSTLVRGLMTLQFGVLSEECVLLGRDGSARGLTRGLRFDGARPAPPGFASTRYLTASADGVALWSRLLLPPEERVVRLPWKLVGLAVLEHSPAASVGRARLTAGEALAALWPVTLNASRQVLDQLTDVVSSVPAWRFSSRSPDQALELACALARDHGLTPAPPPRGEAVVRT